MVKQIVLYHCLGLTAIEIWMLSCILFVFGALIGDIKPPVCSTEFSSVFHCRVRNHPVQKTNEMYKSQENPEQQLSGEYFFPVRSNWVLTRFYPADVSNGAEDQL